MNGEYTFKLGSHLGSIDISATLQNGIWDFIVVSDSLVPLPASTYLKQLLEYAVLEGGAFILGDTLVVSYSTKDGWNWSDDALGEQTLMLSFLKIGQTYSPFQPE
jgi:hypothetical protein